MIATPNDSVCAECGFEQCGMIACGACGSVRVVSISLVEQEFGPNWRAECFPTDNVAPEDVPVGLSISGGASSEWLPRAIIEGLLPRPKHVAAFFSDTGDEHEWTYERLERLAEDLKAAGIPFIRTSHKEMLVDAVLSATRGERSTVDNPPYWTENPGGGRGQLTQKCTRTFKLRAIRRAQWAWLKSLGLPKKIVSYVGFGTDEQHRATKAVANSEVKWAGCDFPAIRLGKGRAEVRADIVKWTGDAPLFSMCRKCPYKNHQRWQQTTKADLEGVVEFDEAIRHGLEHVGVIDPVYLTDQLTPIDIFLKRGVSQTNLPGFEVPGCDSGMCFL